MIELTNVSKKYKGKEVLNNVSLKIDKSGFYSLIGDNGEGKTTLANIIIGAIKPTNKGKVKRIENNYSFISQSINLIDYLTVKEHLDLFKINYNVINKYHLKSKLNSYPSQLSFGQRQRIACLLAINSSPNIIICDEPTSHLDDKNKEMIFKELKKCSKKKIVFLISHDVRMIEEYSDVIYKLKNGKLLKIKNSFGGFKKIVKDKRKIKGKYLFKRLVSNCKLNILFFIIIFLSSFTILLCVQFDYNYQMIIKKEIDSSPDYNKFYLKKCEKHKKESFSVTNCRNPNEKELFFLKQTPNYLGFNYEIILNELYQTEKLKTFHSKSVALKEGRYPLKYNEVIASENYKLNEVISLKSNYLLKGKKIDIYNKTLDLVVVGIKKDSFFNNQEMLFLDHLLLERYFENEELINNEENLKNFFLNLEIENYRYVLFFKNINIELLNENNISFISSSYELYENLETLYKKVKPLLEIIKFVIVLFAIMFLNKVEKKRVIKSEKEYHFYRAMGVKDKTIRKERFKERIVLIISAYVVSNILVKAILTSVFKEYYEFNLLFSLMFYLAFIIFSKILGYKKQVVYD